jgi:hypothetical protein
MRKQYMRITSLFVAVTFQVVVWSDDAGLHGCPFHDAIGVEAVSAVSATDHSSATDHHAAVAHAPDTDTNADAHEHVCTCVGSCQGAGNAPLATTASVERVAAAPESSAAPALAPHRELPAPPAFLLPYSQGPPHLA